MNFENRKIPGFLTGEIVASRVWIIAVLCGWLCHTGALGGETPLKQREEIEKSLRLGFLEVWFPRCLDTEHGGFLCDFDANWQAAGPQHKTIVFQGRMTWLASRAALRYPQDRRYHAAADHGFRFLRDVMWDKDHGGWYFHLDCAGKLTSEWKGVKHAYGIGFGIYGASGYYKLTHDPQALDLAKQGFSWLDRHGHDDKSGGYFEYFTQDGSPILDDAANPLLNRPRTDAIGTRFGYKSMNTHIHLLEALTELYRVWPDAGLKARVTELLHLVRDRIIAPPGAMHQFFNLDWTPVPDLDSFGHDVETGYLLLETARALGIPDDPKTLAAAKSLVDHAIDYGWDKDRGGFFEAGGTFGPAREKNKIWWIQAEGLNGLSAMTRRFPNDPRHYQELFSKQWEYIKAELIDARRGGWYLAGLDAGGKATAPKSSEWKAGYHDGRALLNASE